MSEAEKHIETDRLHGHGVPSPREPILTGPTPKGKHGVLRITGGPDEPILPFSLRQLYSLPRFSSYAVLGSGQDVQKLARHLHTLGDYFDIEAVRFYPDPPIPLPNGPASIAGHGVVVIYCQKRGQADVTTVTLCMPPKKNLVGKFPSPQAFRDHIEALFKKHAGKHVDADSYDLVATSHRCAMCLEDFVRGDYSVPVHAKASGSSGSLHFVCLMDAGVSARDIFDIQDSVVVQEVVWIDRKVGDVVKKEPPVEDCNVSRHKARELIWSVQRCPSERAHRLKWKKYRATFVEHARKYKSNAPAAVEGDK